MIVQCKNCKAKFNVIPDRIKDEGSNVRCSSCKHVFKIFKPDSDPVPAPLPEPEPEIGDDLDFGSVEGKVDEPAASEKDRPSGDFDIDDIDGDSGFGKGGDSPGDAVDFGGLEETATGLDDFDFGDLDGDPESGTLAGPGEDSLPGDDLGGDFDFGDLDGDPESETLAGPGEDSLPGDDLGGDFDFGDLDGDPESETLAGPGGDSLPGDDLGGDFDFGDLDGDLELGEPAAQGSQPGPEDDLGGDFDFGGLDGDLDLGEPASAGDIDEAPGLDTGFAESGAQDDESMDFGDLDDFNIGESSSFDANGDSEASPASDDMLSFDTFSDTLGDAVQNENRDDMAVSSDDDDLDFGGLGDDFELGEPDTLIEDKGPRTNEGEVGDGGLDDMNLEAGGDDFPGFAGEEIPEDEESLDFGDQFTDLGPEVDVQVPSEDKTVSDFDFGDSDGMEIDEFGQEAETPRDTEGNDLVFVGPEGEEEDTKPPSTKKRGFQWILVGIFGFLTLMGAVFFFVPDLLAPVLKPLGLVDGAYNPSEDPDGNQYLSIEKTTHYFGANQYLGNIMVISGLVVNHYPKPRSGIRVKGMLHNKAGDKLLGVKQVYGGNWLSGEEIESLPYNEIIKRLRVETGQDNINVNVPPEDSVKYMIVFDKIPETLGSYTVEALGSEPAGE